MNFDNNIYVVTTTKPPSYIRCLTNSGEEIVLVHSRVKNTTNIDESFIPEELKNEVSLDGSLLDITGSPMKYSFDNSAIMCMSLLDHCQNNWSKEEESHYPLTIEQARQFIRDYFNKNNTSTVVWCVCDALDKEKTILLSFQKQSNFITRSIVKSHGYLSEKLKDGLIDSLHSRHNEIRSKLLERKQESRAFYELYGSAIQDFKDIKTQTKGYVTLQSCTGARSKTTLNVEALVGHPEAASADLWQDLLLLELYINTFSQYETTEQMGDGSWLPTRQTVDNEDPVHLASRIVHEPDRRRRQDKKRSTDILKVVEDMYEHANLDITDRLWSVLVRCSTYGTLVDCLNAFITEIAYNRGKVYIYISESNLSWMAELLRGIISGVLAVPTFTGTQPIQLLILLGIEKLRKNYVHILSQSNVADEQKINTYFKYNDPSHDTSNTHVRKGVVLRDTQLVQLPQVAHEMAVLGRLEVITELLCLVPSDWLSYVGYAEFNSFLGENSPIKSFGDLVGNRLHKLQIELPSRAVQQHEGLCMPVQLANVLESHAQNVELVSTVHLSLRPIFPPCLYPVNPENTVDIKNVCYHFTTMLQITNYFGKK